jgi:hypothetical protein
MFQGFSADLAYPVAEPLFSQPPVELAREEHVRQLALEPQHQ